MGQRPNTWAVSVTSGERVNCRKKKRLRVTPGETPAFTTLTFLTWLHFGNLSNTFIKPSDNQWTHRSLFILPGLLFYEGHKSQNNMSPLQRKNRKCRLNCKLIVSLVEEKMLNKNSVCAALKVLRFHMSVCIQEFLVCCWVWAGCCGCCWWLLLVSFSSSLVLL